jgi:metal-sulfur cluster biosynthetic enzyme
VIHAPTAVSEAMVLDALRGVIDPELDESLVDLGFIDGVRVDDGVVDVVLRLPTFWCAPNFAYLMANDARDAVLRQPGVRQARIALKDHMYGDEIGDGVSAGRPFSQLFDGQAEGDDLDALRRLFFVKAFGMRQEQLVRFLLDERLTNRELTDLRVGDVIDTSDRSGLVLRVSGDLWLLRGGAPLARMYLERRERMAISADRLITDECGRPIAADGLTEYLERVRRQRISMTFNALMCRGMLETRYGLTKGEER